MPDAGRPAPGLDGRIADEHRSNYLEHMRLVPEPVAVIATSDGKSRAGLAATAWNSLSIDPPTLLVCVNRNASAHPVIQRAGAFSVNLLRAEDADSLEIFSSKRGLRGDDRFLTGVWTTGPEGQPIMKDAVVSFECKLEDMHDHSSHTILIGTVGQIMGRRDGAAMLYLNGMSIQAAIPEGFEEEK